MPHIETNEETYEETYEEASKPCVLKGGRIICVMDK
jgi:hypothetical protein